ncbi:MAG TPA: M20/M25/M40 family metallo-hydrolase [Pyrinomonadaceae bacterium]|jgi:hypothetical protein
MKKTTGKSVLEKRRFSASLLVSLLIFGQIFAQTVAPAKAALAANEKEFAARINLQTIKDYTAALAAPEMEGRGTMQRGGDKAANWIADRFKALGLKPLGDQGSYLQKIDFRETAFTPETVFKAGEENLKLGADYTVLPYSTNVAPANAALVFVGYGLSNSFGHNDLAGVDLRDKIAVVIDGPPANVTAADWEKANAKMAVFINLVRSGVAGMIYIGHGREKASDAPEVIIDYLSRRQISLGGEEETRQLIPPIIVAGRSGAEKLFAKSAVKLKDALAQSEQTTFKSLALNQPANIVAKYKTTKGASSNVVGYIEGSDPKLKEEAVLFSAHYDAYGVENGKIYHGAADNALGTAEMLAVAEAFAKSPAKPKRSLIFLAVTGEEYGLFGSKYWAKNPTWDIKKVAGNLNLDGIGTEVYGPVKSFVGYGAEHSTMGAMLEDVTAALGIKIKPDPKPEEKYFYRSDHYSFVERGVPALMLMGGLESMDETMKRAEEWEKADYHQPTDVIQKTWYWDGAKTVADVMGIMGLRLANAAAMPSWLATSRFAKLERGNTKEVPEEK